MKVDTWTMVKLAGAVAVGVLIFGAVRGAKNAVGDLVQRGVDAVQQGFEQAGAEVQQVVGNLTVPFVPSEASKLGLHSDEGYAGIDPVTGLYLLDSPWWQDEEARRYEAELRAAAGARGGATLPVTGLGGAAFGVYPKP